MTFQELLIVVKDFASHNVVQRLLKDSPEKVLKKEFQKLILKMDQVADGDIALELEKLEIFIHVRLSGNNAFGLSSILSDIEPEYIMIYEMDLESIRQIESYKARRPSKPCRVYTLSYSNSVDEQQYLTSSKKEITAFEKMIEEKDSLIKDGSRDEVPDSYDYSKWRRVIVDTREFKSELPGMLHRKQLRIEPAMLEIGDYVLSPEMAVERTGFFEN